MTAHDALVAAQSIRPIITDPRMAWWDAWAAAPDFDGALTLCSRLMRLVDYTGSHAQVLACDACLMATQAHVHEALGNTANVADIVRRVESNVEQARMWGGLT